MKFPFTMILALLVVIILMVYLFNNDRFHLSRTEWFYSSGLSNDNPDSWELTFGYWDNDTDSYRKAAENLYDRIFSSMDINEDSTVVSVGCGMGTELIYMYNKYKPKKVIAVDITYEHVKRAKRLIIKNGLQDKIEVIYGSGTELTKHIEPNSVTHVYTIEAVNNMPSFHDFVNGANEILVDGGTLAFADGFTYQKHNDLKSRCMTYIISLLWSIHLSNNRTFNDMINDLKTAGFQQQNLLDLTDNVWKGYCDFKVKNYLDDVKDRGSYIHAKLFKLCNEYLYYYTTTFDIKYLIYVGKKINKSQALL